MGLKLLEMAIFHVDEVLIYSDVFWGFVSELLELKNRRFTNGKVVF